MKALLAVLFIIPVLLLSGCTIPGIGTIFGPATTAYENDVVIIKELTALPDTVAPGQPVKLVAYVQNVGNKPIDFITIELYDYCQGQFTLDDKSKYEKIQLLPGQIKEVDWELTTAQLKLPTSCAMKTKVTYLYDTQALSTISFIQYEEYQRLLSEGKFSNTQPYIAQGYGPLKPLLNTLEQQPIPAPEGGKFTATFEIENEGGGFIAGNKIDTDQIQFSSPSGGVDNIISKLNSCKGEWKTIEFVQQKSTKLICENIPTPKVATENTVTITTEILGYGYEFRKDVTVNIKPVS